MTSKFFGLCLALTLAFSSVTAIAQVYPAKPIRFVVGYAPGGSNDILARIVGQKLSERLGQSVIIENKPGADSNIAAAYVAKAAPDGYTLLIGSSGTMTINPNIYQNLPFDPEKDFIPITLFASDPLVFAVNPTFPATSLKELVTMARAKPGSLSYASGAPPMYVATELFKKQAGVDMMHIPYKGSGPSVMAAVTGEVPLVVVSIGPALAQLRAGKLRPLAVTAQKRAHLLPDTPTVKEAIGIDLEGGTWVGLFAPAATPSAIIDKLYSELSIVLQSDNLKEKFASYGYDTSSMGLPPAEFGAFFRANLAKWKKVTKELNIKIN